MTKEITVILIKLTTSITMCIIRSKLTKEVDRTSRGRLQNVPIAVDVYDPNLVLFKIVAKQPLGCLTPFYRTTKRGKMKACNAKGTTTTIN